MIIVMLSEEFRYEYLDYLAGGISPLQTNWERDVFNG